MPFFAVINDDDLRVRRIDLTPDLASELEGRFSGLATSTFSSEVDRVPFRETLIRQELRAVWKSCASESAERC